MVDYNKVITFDGTSASGKGTIASRVAQHYGYAYLDTGRLYRALAYLLNSNSITQDFVIHAKQFVSKINEEILRLTELNSDNISELTSKIAVFPEIRDLLFNFQIDFIEHHGEGVVLDGRDTGSIICPQAKHKFFIDADPETRAKRRYEQIKDEQPNATVESILANIITRDERDKNRKIAPLVIPANAYVIDNTHETIDQIVKKIVYLIDYS